MREFPRFPICRAITNIRSALRYVALRGIQEKRTFFSSSWWRNIRCWQDTSSIWADAQTTPSPDPATSRFWRSQATGPSCPRKRNGRSVDLELGPDGVPSEKPGLDASVERGRSVARRSLAVASRCRRHVGPSTPPPGKVAPPSDAVVGFGGAMQARSFESSLPPPVSRSPSCSYKYTLVLTARTCTR